MQATIETLTFEQLSQRIKEELEQNPVVQFVAPAQQLFNLANVAQTARGMTQVPEEVIKEIDLITKRIENGFRATHAAHVELLRRARMMNTPPGSRSSPHEASQHETAANRQSSEQISEKASGIMDNAHEPVAVVLPIGTLLTIAVMAKEALECTAVPLGASKELMRYLSTAQSALAGRYSEQAQAMAIIHRAVETTIQLRKGKV